MGVKEVSDQFFEFDVHLESRTIYLGDSSDDKSVGPEMASKFIKAMHLLHESGGAPIKILMNTIGGCVYSGFAIYDCIKTSPCEVTIEVIGSAMSMGAYILQGADVRVIYPNAVIMLHDGTESIDAGVRSFENWATFSRLSRKASYDILSERTGKSARYWEKKCTDDYILDAKQALKENLVDRIAGLP